MKSQFGDRETVGSIYTKAQLNDTTGLILPDIGSPMSGDLVTDLNETFASNPFEGRPFYVNCVEERDLQMKNAFKRRLFKTLYRPYPEDNTLVFHMDPKTETVKFCWDVPHHSEFLNILTNSTLYDPEYVQRIRDWCNNDLSNFGYVKVSMGSSQVEGYDEKIVNMYKQNYINYCESIQMDPKALETEKKLGFFWIPNKFLKDKDVTARKTKILMAGNHA